jgi:hypothetical protein
MRTVFAFGLSGAIAIVGLCGLTIAATLTTDAAAGARQYKVEVNRALKGDRLPQSAPAQRNSGGSSGSETTASPKTAPIGCDPAFSPISAPSLAHIFKRCMA